MLGQRRRSGWAEYAWRDKAGRRARVSVAAVYRRERARPPRRRDRKRPAPVEWYAFWGLAPSSCRWVRETYRLRFGIETTYRQLHQARIRTCTRDPRLRLLYVGIALILRNVWVWLHWEVLARPRRGGRRVDLGRLRFRQLLWWLQRLVEGWWMPRDGGAAEEPPPTERAKQPRRSRTSNY